MHCR
jgi:hypothetical protein